MKGKKILVIILALAILTPPTSAGIVIKRHYTVLTNDLRTIDLYRYTHLLGAEKTTPILLVPGWTENHLIFDANWIPERSLARYLAHDGWDVWVCDLRTHDTDGDPGKAAENEENMWKYWDFDKTYVQRDTVAAVNYVKRKTGEDQLVLGGHSMGGMISAAYAMLEGQGNLAGLITIASPSKPMIVPPAFKLLMTLFCNPDGHVKLLAPINFDPNNELLIKLMLADMASYDEGDATEWWLNWNYIGTLNDEPAGVCADLWWGLDLELHEHWLDPDGYDYTDHIPDITVPYLSVAGIQDEMALLEQTQGIYELAGSSDKTSLIFDGYGHVDLLIGRNAPTEIYPEIATWLNTRYP
jgi:pimeloyl-ACP methyl ester carboxylesterase